MSARYQVLVCGYEVSRHRTADGAQRAARAIVREAGLEDDGAYCGDDGWPTIVDTRTGASVEYEVAS